MITDIKLTFRHLHDVSLSNLAAVNIIVGPNNAGKTSIFRGIQTATKDTKIERPDCSLRIGTTLPETLILNLNWERLRLSAYWTAVIPSGRENFWQDQIDEVRFSNGGLERRSPSATLWVPKGHVPLDGVKPIQASLNRAHTSWLDSLYFLWHRRKSRYQEELGSYHARLDEEAEYLAGRLDHIQAGANGLKVRREIDRFMLAVVPGLGEIGIRRTQGENNRTMIAIVFSGENGERSLDELGGGVEQVLALAMVLIGEQDEGAVFIEEPESHLHESAQRRLIEQVERYRGKRQIFIATHSPVFVNSFPGANVYRVTRGTDGKATVHPCLDHQAQRTTLDELGVLPSSLIQTNCVVWIEGPTEARLVRHWLTLLAPELRLHQHYEFAETGGSNIVQLAADLDTGDKDTLRDVMKVCRHNFVICDRDAGIGNYPSKRPVADIAKTFGAHHWVTHGYEIEWYFPAALIEKLWSPEIAKHMATLTTASTAFYTHMTASGIKGTKTAEARKVRNAERAVALALPAAEWFAGDMGKHLHEQVTRLADFIRSANQMQVPAGTTCPHCKQSVPG